MKGIIYALANSAMPDIVKIGKTNDLTRRMTQLYSTGVPMPFDCICARRVEDVDFVESKLHSAFASRRVNEKREFFKALKAEMVNFFDLIPGEDLCFVSSIITSHEEISWSGGGARLTTPEGDEVEAESVSALYNKLHSMQFSLPKYQTVISRKNKGWTLEEAFGFSVPPNYREADRLVVDGYSYYPSPPTEDGNRIPMISHHERRVYLSQDEFAKEHGIPSDYISDKLKLGWDASRIIEEYKNNEQGS